MKIIVLGAGQVGSSVARNLVKDSNDITIVDVDSTLLKELQDTLDLKCIEGQASHPDVLRQAGADDADMLIAVTNSDETNMVACQIAWSIFHTPLKIARVRSQAYLDYPHLFTRDVLPVDVLISPEQMVTEYILRLIQYPGALQVVDFANGLVRLVGIKAYYGGPLVGHELKTLHEHMPDIDVRVAAIFRKGRERAIFPDGHTVIEADDEVFFIAATDHIRAVMSELRSKEKPYKRIIIAGGGNIGQRLARALEHTHRVKIIEHGKDSSERLSHHLKNCMVLHGNAADEDLLKEENIEDTDVFCAVTNDDEANILSSMLAKNLGARKVMSLINRASYVDLVQSGPIDIAISPQQATIGALLTHIRRGDVVKVHSLRRDKAEAIEAVAHGDKVSSKVVGRKLEDIVLPEDTIIGAIVREDEVLMAHHDTVIMSEDHVILFVSNKNKIPAVEKLFQVGVTFL